MTQICGLHFYSLLWFTQLHTDKMLLLITLLDFLLYSTKVHNSSIWWISGLNQLTTHSINHCCEFCVRAVLLWNQNISHFVETVKCITQQSFRQKRWKDSMFDTYCKIQHQTLNKISSIIQYHNLSLTYSACATTFLCNLFYLNYFYHYFWFFLVSKSLTPSDSGWTSGVHGYELVLLDLMASEDLLKLKSCNHHGDCSNRQCRYKKNGVTCTLTWGVCKGMSCRNCSQTKTMIPGASYIVNEKYLYVLYKNVKKSSLKYWCKCELSEDGSVCGEM